jgi:hypothetical protein
MDLPQETGQLLPGQNVRDIGTFLPLGTILSRIRFEMSYQLLSAEEKETREFV